MSAERVFQIIDEGTPEELRVLLAERPVLATSRNEAGVSAVLYTLYQRKEEHRAVVLAAEPELDAVDAAALGDVDRLKSLVGDDPDCVHRPARDGFFPLHVACFFADSRTVDFLLDLGTDVSVVSGPPMNLQPLHSAAAAGNLDSCRLLLERGANPDATQQGGWTPLHSAAMHGNLALASLLIEFGAGRSLAADVGKTALDLARDGGHDEIAALLAAE